jgi:hypothetical protein
MREERPVRVMVWVFWRVRWETSEIWVGVWLRVVRGSAIRVLRRVEIGEVCGWHFRDCLWEGGGWRRLLEEGQLSHASTSHGLGKDTCCKCCLQTRTICHCEQVVIMKERYKKCQEK